MKRLLVLLGSISFVAGAPQVINEDAVLVASSPYFCRTTSDQTKVVSVYANEYKVFGEPQILKRPNLLPKDCDSGNYLAVNFFVAGDVGGCGRAGAVTYRDIPLSFAADQHAVVWKSNRARDLDGHNFSQVQSTNGLGRNAGHTELQFIYDFRNTIMKKDPDKFVDLMTKGANKKIRHYGFCMDSIFDLCDDCAIEMYSFMNDRGQTSLHKFLEDTAKPKIDERESKLKPLIIFHSRSFYSCYDQIWLHNGVHSHQMSYSGGQSLSLKDPNTLYRGRLSIKFDYDFSDEIYFSGRKIGLPPIICRPLRFFDSTRKMVDNFSYEFSGKLAEDVAAGWTQELEKLQVASQ